MHYRHIYIYTLSLHYSLPIWGLDMTTWSSGRTPLPPLRRGVTSRSPGRVQTRVGRGSEEDKYALQTHLYLHPFPTLLSSDLGLGHDYLVVGSDAFTPSAAGLHIPIAGPGSAAGRADCILVRGLDRRGRSRRAGCQHEGGLGALPIGTQNGTVDGLRTCEQERGTDQRRHHQGERQ